MSLEAIPYSCSDTDKNSLRSYLTIMFGKFLDLIRLTVNPSSLSFFLLKGPRGKWAAAAGQLSLMSQGKMRGSTFVTATKPTRSAKLWAIQWHLNKWGGSLAIALPHSILLQLRNCTAALNYTFNIQAVALLVSMGFFSPWVLETMTQNWFLVLSTGRVIVLLKWQFKHGASAVIANCKCRIICKLSRKRD